jgi:hypothetical protein
MRTRDSGQPIPFEEEVEMTPATDHVLGGPLARASHHGSPDPVAEPVFTRWRTEAVKLTPLGRLLLALLIVVTVWGVYGFFRPLDSTVVTGGFLVGALSYVLLEHVRRRRTIH